MKRKLSGIIILLLALCFVPMKAASQDELVIGLIPEENIFKQMDRYRPLAEYLSSRLGINVKLTILSSYGDIIDKFVRRKMDGAFFGALTGVLAAEKLGIEPIAKPVKLDGTTSVRSFVFVRKDSGIKSVSDMKEKRMAFVDRTTVSYLFALAFFREHGVKDIDSYFKEYYFTGSHDSAIYSVLDNRADMGAAESKVYDRVVKKYPGIRDDLHILAESGEFPDTTLYLTKELSVDIKKGIKGILLNMAQEEEGREVLKKLEALQFVEAGDQDSLPLLDLAEKAGVTIQSYRYK